MLGRTGPFLQELAWCLQLRRPKLYPTVPFKKKLMWGYALCGILGLLFFFFPHGYTLVIFLSDFVS